MFDVRKDVAWSKAERRILQSLSTPAKIQDYLDTLAQNFEPSGDTVCSPRVVMRTRTAHCIEGALLAAVALAYHGQKALILDLVSSKHDMDHVMTLFTKKSESEKYWGALSKTNHGVLRYREPIYMSVRELAMSCFHEYFLDNGSKTLRQYSEPIDILKMKDKRWITSEENLWHIVDYINEQKHFDMLTRSQIAGLRKAHKTEREAGKIVEYKRPVPRAGKRV